MLDLNEIYRQPIDALRFMVWNADDDVAQAAWEWPAWGDFRRFPKTRVLHSDRVRAIDPQAFWNQKPHTQRQFYGN